MNKMDKKFGQLRLSIKGTHNGRGCDIFYDFGKSLDFVEFTSKNEFYFLQPWMQFAAHEYSDECLRVSIELVKRFNDFESLERRIKTLEEELKMENKRSLEIKSGDNIDKETCTHPSHPNSYRDEYGYMICIICGARF